MHYELDILMKKG